MEKIERINKYLSESGVCSRREVDDLISQGRVEVNGQPAHIGMQIDTERDTVTVDGQKVDPSNPAKNAISQEALDELERKRNPWWAQHNELKRQKLQAKMQNPKSKLLRKKAKSGTAGERRVLPWVSCPTSPHLSLFNSWAWLCPASRRCSVKAKADDAR